MSLILKFIGIKPIGVRYLCSLTPFLVTRKFITFTTLLQLATAGFSKQPPAAVLKTFGEKFPGITKVAWSKENAREWEAEFLINNKKTSATFAVDGTWKETEITTG